jgi:hypothetical protein
MMAKGRLFCFCLTALLLAVPLNSKAQGCISFSNDYAAYADESMDTTNLYVDAVVDGSGTMTINRNLPGCGSLPGQATHTPQISIWVTASPSGTLYGATTPGAGQCADCYLSEETTQTIPIGTDTDWQGNWSAGVICSMAGGIWGTGGPLLFSLKMTYWGPPPTPTQTGCIYTMLACSTGRATCMNTRAILFSEGCPNYIWELNLVVNGSYCVPGASMEGAASGPGPCS